MLHLSIYFDIIYTNKGKIGEMKGIKRWKIKL